MSSATALNLEKISSAIDQHDSSCPQPAVAVLMNWFELQRLGWEEIRGLPIHGSERMPSGRFEVVCDRVDHYREAELEAEEKEAAA